MFGFKKKCNEGDLNIKMQLGIFLILKIFVNLSVYCTIPYYTTLGCTRPGQGGSQGHTRLRIPWRSCPRGSRPAPAGPSLPLGP